MPRTYDVLVIGNYTIDLIFTGLPRFPELGKDTIGSGFEMVPGEAYTNAVAMHRLGLKVGWAADFGNDEFSRLAMEFTRREGLDESLFIHHDRPLRRISVAMSFPHERGFVTYYDPDPPMPAAMKALVSTNAQVLYIPGLFYGSMFQAGLVILRSKKMKLVMDGNSSDETMAQTPAVRKAIQATDIFMPNASEALRLTGDPDIETALRNLSKLCPMVVIKDGANGAYALADGEVVQVPAITVTPADTVGAGDCFDAGFLKGWLTGRPLDQCLRWGNIAGGLSTLGCGGTSRKITQADLDQWEAHYESHPR